MRPLPPKLLLIFIGIFGITGSIFLFKNNTFNKVPAKSSIKTSPSSIEIPDAPPSWKSYLEIEKDIEILKQNWTASDSESNLSVNIEMGNNGDNLDLEVFYAQTNQIERILKEEVTFKLLMLNNNISAYGKKLAEEKERQVKEKTAALKYAFDLFIKNKEKENRDILKSFEQGLRANYQNLLSNLQLQLSVSDLIDDENEQDKQKKKFQAEIDHIHQEVAAKLKSRQLELNTEFLTSKTEHLKENEIELNKFQIELETSFSNDLAHYKNKLEEEFKTWRSNREKEAANALELRQKQKNIPEPTKSN